MDSNKTIQVHEFDPAIYPSLLWVVIGNKTISDRFRTLELMDENALAETEPVNDILQNRNGVIIRFRSRKNMTTEIITHESVHAAAEIMRYVGGRVEVENQEPFAYLAGWVADCCNQVKKNKFKP